MADPPATIEARPLEDDVTVIDTLGRGAQTVVYRIRRDGIDYAMKVPERPTGDEDRVAAEFYREAALLARVGAPGVPTVHDVGVRAGRPYLILEYLDGRTLAEVLKAGPLPEARILTLARE